MPTTALKDYLAEPLLLSVALLLSPSGKAYYEGDKVGLLIVERLPPVQYNVGSHLIHVVVRGCVTATLKCHTERELSRILTYNIVGGALLTTEALWQPLEMAYAAVPVRQHVGSMSFEDNMLTCKEVCRE